MGKHAYLIIAHNKFEQLKMLCEMLDFEQNDIYMHIDAHVTDFDADSFRPSLRHSKMKFAERTRVNWGGYSQIQAEFRGGLQLLSSAVRRGSAAASGAGNLGFLRATGNGIYPFFRP